MKYGQINEGSIFGPDMDALTKATLKELQKAGGKAENVQALAKKLYNKGSNDEELEKFVGRISNRLRAFAGRLDDIVEKGLI